MATHDVEQQAYARKDTVNRYLFWAATFIAHIVLFLPELLWREGWKIELFGGVLEMHWAYLAAFVATVLNANPRSWKTQEQGFVGGKSFAGALLYQTGPGPIYTLWGFCKHESEESRVNNAEIPTDLPDHYRFSEGERTKLRMSSAHAKDQVELDNLEKLVGKDPLSTGRLTLEVTIPIEWALDDSPGAWRQYKNRIGSRERLLALVDDRVVGQVRKQVVNRTPSEVFTQWADIEGDALGQIQHLSENCGLSQLRVLIKEFDLPHAVNTALAERTAQHTNVEKSRLEGVAKQLKDKASAEGEKALAAAPLAAIAEVLKEAMKPVEEGGLGFTSADALLMAYTKGIEQVAVNAKYSLIPQGRGGLLDPAAMMAILTEGMKAADTQSNTRGGNA